MNAACEIEVTVNNHTVCVPDGLSLANLLERQSLDRITGIAVAVNGAVVQHSNWKAVSLTDGDQIVIVSASQGG